ncbi:hypothetical protein ACLK1Y_19635 [Escherichia coli]
MIFAIAVGIPVGVLAAVKRGSIFDHTRRWPGADRLFHADFLGGA